MKKGILILVGIVIIMMSGLTNLAISLSSDPQWTPFVLSWDRQLKPNDKKFARKQLSKAKDTIPLCGSNDSMIKKLQR